MQAEIERLFDEKPDGYTEANRRLFYEFQDALNEGRVRAAEPDAASATGWRVNAWVKKGILLGFRMGAVIDMSIDSERQPERVSGQGSAARTRPSLSAALNRSNRKKSSSV